MLEHELNYKVPVKYKIQVIINAIEKAMSALEGLLMMVVVLGAISCYQLSMYADSLAA